MKGLPKLRLPVIKEGEPDNRKSVTCLGKDHCKDCVFYRGRGGRCEGCTIKHKGSLADNFASCFQECHTCAGYKTLYTAICCKSPLKDTYLTAVTKGADDWNKPEYSYTKRPVLEFESRAILYISSSINTVTARKHMVDGHEAVAVNLTRVWSKKGFYSRDLKDYLCLPAKTKLLLMTMTIDDLLERAWDSEMYADPEEFQRCGIDAWMPLSFSSYPDEARMHQIYQFYRTLYCTEKGAAWWTTGDHFMGEGLDINDLYLEAVAKVPQVVFNTQFVSDEATMRHHIHLAMRCHEITPKHVPFWFVGACTPTFLHNIRRYTGSRILYWLSPRPLYLAGQGHAFTMSGGAASSTDDKMTLLRQNHATFATIVREYGT